jgi:hypothetical protein
MSRVEGKTAEEESFGPLCAPIEGPPDPLPLPTNRQAIVRWLGPAISAGVIVAVLFNIHKLSFHGVESMVPRAPDFWLLFVGCYLALPFSEWIIYRRLWGVRADALAALLRKLVSNEILIGYIGEVSFYSWARTRSAMVGAPFGAIKDVAILSAVIGNAVTLVLALLSWPFLSVLSLGHLGRPLYVSAITMVLISSAIMLFRKRLFSLPRHDIRFVLLVHLTRLLGTTALTALMWHVVLPIIALRWWLLLAALRMLVSRLPFLPNKDFVFAGVAVLVVGRHTDLADLLTMMATLVLGTHAIVGLGLIVTDAGAVRKPAA